MNNALMQNAIQFAEEHESAWDRTVGGVWGVHQNDPPPWNRLLGPVHDRGPVSGTVVVDGRTVASWGEPQRADLTFSVAKMYLALLAGVAHDGGCCRTWTSRCARAYRASASTMGRNAGITWRRLLQQTSEWEGERFGVPDQVDRYRAVTFGDPPGGKKGDPRPLRKPGTYWEYNDVRINQLSFALLHLFRRPLPELFREAISRFRWAPAKTGNGVEYDNAWVDIDGRRMRSVPGGSHWGGGMSISSVDQALIGRMLLDGGQANGRQVLSPEWIQAMRTPCAIAPYYGFLIWPEPRTAGVPQRARVQLLRRGRGQLVHLMEPSGAWWLWCAGWIPRTPIPSSARCCRRSMGHEARRAC